MQNNFEWSTEIPPCTHTPQQFSGGPGGGGRLVTAALVFSVTVSVNPDFPTSNLIQNII